jgi:superfamily I DNA/RNA helicase/RecB family exonuclease
VRDPFPPTPEQLAVIEHEGPNLLVLAGPGTGKTETLARRFAWLVSRGTPPHRILLLTFSRRAAEEMRNRVLLRLRQQHGRGLAVTELFVKTFHGFCSRLLDADDVRRVRAALLTPVRERLLWRSLMRSASLSLPSFDPSVRDSTQFAADALNLFAQLKGQGVSAHEFARLACTDRRLQDLALLFARMEDERRARDLHDYRDLVNEANEQLRDPDSRAAGWLRSAGFEHILVDEFQDSDRMQLRLLEAMRDRLFPPPAFCFVGDMNQSIYRFRGATPDNVSLAETTFGCIKRELHLNRRSVPVILELANADASLDPASLTQAVPGAGGGSVRLRRPRTLDDEVRCVRDEIVRAVAAGTPPSAIAVLLRQTHPCQELIIQALREATIPVAPQPTAGFRDDPLIDAVLTALRLLAQPQDQRLWRRLLENPILGYRPLDVRLVFDEARRRGHADPQSALAALPPPGPRPMRKLLAAWRRCQNLFATGAGALDLVRTVVAELDLLRPLRGEPIAPCTFDPHASPARLADLFSAAADYSTQDGDALSFVRDLDEIIGLLADAHQPPPAGLEGVRVISIHAAKGLEFDFVVIPQALEGVLPAEQRPHRLLSAHAARTLAGGGIRIFADDDPDRREEHSLWYVAVTRARRDVLVTAPQVDDDGVPLTLSSFAQPLEQALPPAADTHVGAAPIPEPALEGAASGDAQALRKTPGVLLPIHIDLTHLSPTAVGTYLQCPRRFFYQSILRLPDGEDDAMRTGKLLHTVLAAFHKAHGDFTDITTPQREAEAAARFKCELHAELDRALREADGDRTPGSPITLFEVETLTRNLSQYAAWLARDARTSPFRVLACEHNIEWPYAGVTLRGVVDRVDELVDGGLVIRDYKAGSGESPLAHALGKVLRKLDEGRPVFGDVPSKFNPQTLLYVTGVENMWREPVVRVEYIYFRGMKGSSKDAEPLPEDDERTNVNGARGLVADVTHITDADGPAAPGCVTRGQLQRVERELVAPIVQTCRDGQAIAFATTTDERLCRFCAYERICPGAGTIGACSA